MRLKIEDAAYIGAFLLSLHAKMLKHKSIFVFSTDVKPRFSISLAMVYSLPERGSDIGSSQRAE